MAQNKFTVPSGNAEPEQEFNRAPVPLAPCRFLREKRTGFIHHYSEELAKRSDLVEPYDGELPAAGSAPDAQAKPKKPAAKKKPTQQVAPVATDDSGFEAPSNATASVDQLLNSVA